MNKKKTETVLIQRVEKPIAFERKSSRLTTLQKPARRNAMEKSVTARRTHLYILRNHVQLSTKSQMTGIQFYNFH